MEKQIKMKIENECPLCGEQFNTYCTDSYIYDSYYVYEMECNTCKGKYKDWYKMEYDVTTYEE